MKHFLKTIIATAILLPLSVFAINTSWNGATDGSILEPFSFWNTAVIKGSSFTATSTTATSTFAGKLLVGNQYDLTPTTASTVISTTTSLVIGEPDVTTGVHSDALSIVRGHSGGNHYAHSVSLEHSVDSVNTGGTKHSLAWQFYTDSATGFKTQSEMLKISSDGTIVLGGALTEPVFRSSLDQSTSPSLVTRFTRDQKGGTTYGGDLSIFLGRYTNSGINAKTAAHFALNDTDTDDIADFNDTKMTLLGDGRLGIGTTTPYATLALQNTSTNPSFVVNDTTNDTSPFIIDASGNVGIGTIAPESKLTVVGSSYTARVTSVGEFSNTGGRTQSEIFGQGASVVGTQSVAIGNSAIVSAGGGGTRAVAIGYSADAANRSIAIGWDATAVAESIAIGGVTTAANQLVLGPVATRAINDVYIGNGVTSGGPSSVTINSTGGAGTNVAGANLTLAGGKGTGSANGGSILFSTSDVEGSGSTLQSLSEKMRITTEGNIGIGTTSPYAKLSVAGEAVAEKFTATSITATSTFLGGLNIANGGLVYDFATQFVGIGTESPTAVLNIATSTGSSTVRFTNTKGAANNGDVIGAFEFESSDLSTNANGVRARIAGVFTGQGGGSDIRFYNKPNNSATEFERFRLASSGYFSFNAGNGATAAESAANAFHLIKDRNSNDDLTSLDGSMLILESKRSNSDVSIQFQGTNVGSTWSLGIDDSLSQSFVLHDITNGVPRLVVDEVDGYVGIGTTNPSEKLEINGGMRLNTATAKPTCDSAVRGTFWFTQSAPGVKDAVEVCAKDAADAYAWRTIY